MSQYLYLIQCKEAFKIGASDVRSRLASLQTGNPYELELQACWEFSNAEPVERALHQAFEKSRMLGEWFLLSDPELEKFGAVCAMLGGVRIEIIQPVSDDEIEEAEEEIQYLPTVEDVKRIMQDSNYRLEYRYNDFGLRGFAWRLRNTNKPCVLYVGKSNPCFEEIKSILPEHQTTKNVSKGESQ